MSGSLLKRLRSHRTATVAVLVIYAFIASTVDLLHSEGCPLRRIDAVCTATISSNDECPACAFLAGHSSTGPDHGVALVGAESLLISQPVPRLMSVSQHEWASSVLSRAPPSTSIS